MSNKLRFYVSPYFIIRFYILRDIKRAVKDFNFSGNMLDIGCGNKPYKYLFNVDNYIGIDFKHYSRNKDYTIEKPDIFFTKDYLYNLELPFKNNSFDNIASFQVLEHHKDPDKFISEISRILKKQGKALLSFPFIESLHEVPYDYQRLSEYGIEELLKKHGLKILKIYRQGSIFSTISFLTNEYLNELASKNILMYLLIAFIYIPFLLFQYFCLVLDKFVPSNYTFMNYLIVIIKT